MWSHDVVGSVLYLSSDLKMGHYLKIPPRVMVFTQVWGTILGTLIILASAVINASDFEVQARLLTTVCSSWSMQAMMIFMAEL